MPKISRERLEAVLALLPPGSFSPQVLKDVEALPATPPKRVTKGRPGPEPIDLKGRTYSCWRVGARAPNIGVKVAWWCLCDCGEVAAVSATSLTRGRSTRCVRCRNRAAIGNRWAKKKAADGSR
jgi:hypothetical protein